MTSDRTPPSRRGILAAGSGATLAAALATGGTARACSPGEFEVRLRDLERRHGARLGVHARDTGTGRTVRHRAHERFPLCSLFKTPAVAAVLRDLDRDGEFLARRIRYTEQQVRDSGYAPVTGLPQHLADGMTVAGLCAAAISSSDNAAANLLLEALGGPAAATRFCRSLGDPATRLDRWEPALNSAEPWRTTDTTTPEAIGETYAQLVLGTALEPADRTRLTGWLLATTTGAARLRAGLPAGWSVADKTGSGKFGTGHDVAVVRPPGRAPLVLAVLTTKPLRDAPPDEALIAETAALLAAALG
ncbi:class A beta-lactamase [Streptomyces sp. NPDC089919]|uniref:class A beta-lactamase n=1 Tax=Streptomyces sp. NPDC089919 TaxID=3155188 RepID=UPI00341D4232